MAERRGFPLLRCAPPGAAPSRRKAPRCASERRRSPLGQQARRHSTLRWLRAGDPAHCSSRGRIPLGQR